MKEPGITDTMNMYLNSNRQLTDEEKLVLAELRENLQPGASMWYYARPTTPEVREHITTCLFRDEA